MGPFLIRYRYAVLAVLAAALLVLRWDVHGDWSYFQAAGDAILGPDGLRVYAQHPQIQIGPLAVGLALPLTLVSWGPAAAKVLIFTAGLVCIRCAELITPRPGLATLTAGSVFLPLWAFVATSGHLDDALAVTGTMLALVAVQRDRSGWAGLALGLAIAAKPWAAMALPLLLGLPLVRDRVRALVVAALATVLVWAPFLVVAPASVRALDAFRFPLKPGTVLHLGLGLPAGQPYPGWVRPVQLLVGLAASLLVVRLGGGGQRGGWRHVPAVAFGVRLLLDPGAWSYYAAGLGAGVLVTDLAAGGLPLLSAAVLAGTGATSYLQLWLIGNGSIPQATRLATRTEWLGIGTAAAVTALVVATAVRDRAVSEKAQIRPSFATASRSS